MCLSLPDCPVEITLQMLGSRWTVLVLRELMAGTRRFGQLRASIASVSQHSLTNCLRAMEEKGLLERRVYAEVPPRVEYTLTATGRSLKPVLDAMETWGSRYRDELTPAL